MFNSTAHRASTVNMLRRILLLGKQLHTSKGMVMGYRDKSENVSSFTVYSGSGHDSATVYEPIYTGIDSEKAADMYIDLVGVQEAFGQAVLFFRTKNATIEVG